MVAASVESLALMAYADDLGIKLEAEVSTDSSAVLGIEKKRTGHLGIRARPRRS